LPGTPVVRYGDEIAMGDNLKLPERNCARTPMQWSTEPNAGFTKSNKPVMPVISAGPYGFEHVNVAAQRRDPNSLMNWMERIIRMRKETPEIGWGDFSFISAQATDILIMRYKWRDNSVILVHNLSPFPREVSFSVGTGPEQACLLINVLSDDHSQPIGGNRHQILLEPYGYRWYRVCGLDYLLSRSPA
jgi:maltose alpha-D-glucosyltransferase/alpha-amylase